MINSSIAAAVCRKIFGGFLPVSVLIIDNVEAEENLDTGGVALDGRYCIARVTRRRRRRERRPVTERASVTRRAPKGGVKRESIGRARSTCRAQRSDHFGRLNSSQSQVGCTFWQAGMQNQQFVFPIRNELNSFATLYYLGPLPDPVMSN